MKQYNSIKTKYPDALLLFRVGDFYETFGEDAVVAAKILGIVQTHRNNGGDGTELAGFPHHSLNNYLLKLVKAGKRVAICYQLEDPKLTKSIVKRGVTELVTPGVALNDDILAAKSNNFLCAIHYDKKRLGISLLDISTGEYLVAEGHKEYISKLLQNFSPSEVLVSKKFKTQFRTDFSNELHAFFVEDWVFQEDYANETLNEHFQTKSLKGFGVEQLNQGIIASGAILYYLSETQNKKLDHITSISRIAEEQYVWMDRFTISNLELYNTGHVNAVRLLDVIDKTISPMGGRMLKRWLALPLKNIHDIRQRHQIVDFFKGDQQLKHWFREQIKQISDLERLISKIATGKINPREIVYLKNSLDAIEPIKSTIDQSKNDDLKALG